MPFVEREWGYVVYLHDVPLELCRAQLGWLSVRFPSHVTLPATVVRLSDFST